MKIQLFRGSRARIAWAACAAGLATAARAEVTLAPPAAGGHRLRILTPTLLELELIQAKPPDPAPLPAWAFVGPDFQLDVPGPQQFSVHADGTPRPVAAVGFKRRVAYAPLRTRDLRVASHLYLQLANPIHDGQWVTVTTPPAAHVSATASFAAAAAPLRANPALHVNQVGYLPGYPKTAMVGHFLGSLGEMPVPAAGGFRLVDAATGREVFSGPLRRRPDRGWAYAPAPYQQVYEADFTAFDTPGAYRLVVPGMGASPPFRIDEGVFMNFARTYALGLYHQRCGTALALPFTRFVHDACHLTAAAVPSPPAEFAFTWATVAQKSADYARNPRHTAPPLSHEGAQLYPFGHNGTIDVSGGHHDAGDYSKYTTNSAALIHTLVFAVDALAGVADLDNLGLPESGDAIPDLLQEARWEADFLAKLQDTDGGFYFLVYPRNRAYESDVLPEHGDPQVVWPKNTAATAAATAALAQCASSPAFQRFFPAEAAAHLRRAKLGWAFLRAALARHGRDGAYQKLTHYGDNFMHDDELAWAATEMFLATGDAAVHDTLRAWFDPADPATRRWGWWRLSEGYGNAIRSYAFAARSGRLAAHQLDAGFRAKCEAEIAAAGDDAMKWSQQSAYGTSFPEETKRARGGGWYFSLDQAFDLAVALQLGVPPLGDLRRRYTEAYLGNLNYEAGCNPVNICYVTGLGQQRPRELVHHYAQNDRRGLPPSGLPLGNLQTGQPYLDAYQGELGALSFPADGAAQAPYPYYDRWSDTYNVSTEFVVVNQARSLAGLAFWAAQTALRTQAWRPAAAVITGLPAAGATGTTTLRLVPPAGLDPARATLVWEAANSEPVSLAAPTLDPGAGRGQWVEVEALWPDGRRVFAASDNGGVTTVRPSISVVAKDGGTTIDAAHPGVLVFARTGDLTAPLTVHLHLTGTAAKWNDYRTPQGDMPQAVTFPAGAATVTLTIVPAPGHAGSLLAPRTIIVSLAASPAYNSGAASTVTFVLGHGTGSPPPATPPSVTTTAPPRLESQIVNFSACSAVGPGASALVVGFVVAGPGRTLLLRGIGPSLGALGVADPLADPRVRLFHGPTELAGDDRLAYRRA